MLSGSFYAPLWKLLMSFNLFPLVTFNYRCLPQSSRPWRVTQGTVTVALSPWQTVTPATTAKRAELIGLSQCRTSLRASSVEWEKFPPAFPTLSKSHTGEMCKSWRYLIPVLIKNDKINLAVFCVVIKYLCVQCVVEPWFMSMCGVYVLQTVWACCFGSVVDVPFCLTPQWSVTQDFMSLCRPGRTTSSTLTMR